MKALSVAPARLAAVITRCRVRGSAVVDGGALAPGACVRAIDRDTFVMVCGQRVEADGSYSLQVPVYYSGLRRLLLAATYPTDQYNAVVADRIMPETVIE